MKILYGLLVVLFLSVGSSTAAIADSHNLAGKYIDDLGDEALAIISDEKTDKQRKLVKLEALFAGNVDFDWVGRFVMGRYWRKASKEQQKSYVEAYKHFLITHYTSRFADYTNGTFKIVDSEQTGDERYSVSMEIATPNSGNQPVVIEYRVRKKTDGFKIYDVIVEGISMIATQRSEFASVLSNKGIDHLIELLATKTDKTKGEVNASIAQR